MQCILRTAIAYTKSSELHGRKSLQSAILEAPVSVGEPYISSCRNLPCPMRILPRCGELHSWHLAEPSLSLENFRSIIVRNEESVFNCSVCP